MANIKVSVKRTGGRKLERFLREAGRGGVSGVKVGFFSTARYEDGTPVAAVAAWNEFGTKNIPERPFFRQAIAQMEDGIANIIKAGINPKKGIVDERLADVLGAYAQGEIQDSITSLKEPPNNPATIARKGSDNPLVDTGFMRHSVTWQVEH